MNTEPTASLPAGALRRSNAVDCLALETKLYTFANCDLGHDVEVVAARLTAARHSYGEALALLAPFERERAHRILAPQAQRQYVLARALLRCLLGKRLGIAPDEVCLTASPKGKPHLGEPHSCSGLRFNASHSRDVAVFAFATGCDVGIDVEFVRPLEHADDIAQRFFSTAETADYLSLQEEDRALGFMNCWTRKEAFIKAAGEGLYMPLDSFDVSLKPGDDAQVYRVSGGDPTDWRIVSFHPFPDFLSAVATQRARVA